MTSIWSEGIIKWTSMTAYLPLCSLAGAMAYWRSRKADSKKRIVAVCAVCALVPILNSAFYALNSSYYARWFYMPVLILAAMTMSAWEDPSLDLARPARSIAFVMIATLAFALVPVQVPPPRSGAWACCRIRASTVQCLPLVWAVWPSTIASAGAGSSAGSLPAACWPVCWRSAACSASSTSALANSANGTPTVTLWSSISTRWP